MKKLLALLVCTTILTFVSCDDEPLEGDFLNGDTTCEAAVLNTAQAALNFAAVNDDTFTQLCVAYRNALEAQINVCGDADGSLQIILDSLGNCVLDGENNCETALDAVDDASFLFTNASSENFSVLCNAFRVALENAILQCGDDDGSLQAQIDELGDCTSDNEENSSIEGTWLLTAWIGTEPIDLNNDGTESINFLDEMDCYNNETILFNSDFTGVIMSTSFATFNFDIVVGTTDEFTYTIDCEFEDENTNIMWSQNGNTISLSDGTGADGPQDYTLSGNELSIFVPEGFTAFNADFTVTTTQDLTFVYTKQ